MVELSLDLGLVYVPKSMSEFLGEVSKIGDGFQKLSMIDDYVKRLEDEMRKIDAFKRELPLCMLLLTDAIGRLKEEEIRCKELNSGSEEVSPFKRNLEEDEISDKKNWMSSVQLWNSDISCDQKKQDEIPELKQRSEEDDPSVSENPIQLCNNTNRDREGAFVPYKGQPGITGLSLMGPISELISCNSGLKNNSSSRFGSLSENKNQMKAHSKTQQQQQPQNSRKQRRCWSPDLHRRFVEALRQLGGSQVATPKQIRELMQVDGLTNDEVKSHLQKYRLHIRRLPAAEANGPCMVQDQCNDQMKGSSSQSSPQGPLLASGSGKGTSSTGRNSMEAEEEEEEKSDGQSWRGGVHKTRETAV